MVLKFLRRPHAQIDLHIEGDQFAAGDLVRFRATIGSRQGFPVRSGKFALECVETYWQIVRNGKRTSERERRKTIAEVFRELLVDGRIQRSIPYIEDSTLTLPDDAPSTVVGKHANISWRLKLSLDVPEARDVQYEQPFTVIPKSPLCLSNGSPSMVVAQEDFSDCELKLELPALKYQAGDSLSGKLRLDAITECNMPEIRIEIVRQEEAGVRGSSTVADQVVLEKDARYGAGRGGQWGFNLRVPEGRWPTTDISNTQVSWRVRAILSRSLRRDYAVEQEITVC